MYATPSAPGVHPLLECYRGAGVGQKACSRDPRQLRRPQASEGASMARSPPALRLPLHANLVLVAQRSRGVLRQTCQTTTEARCLPLRRRSPSHHQPLRRPDQPTPQTLHLDRKPRQNHRRRKAWAPSVRFDPLATAMHKADCCNWPERLSRRRSMCAKEGTYLAHRQRYPLLGFLPRIDADFGLWRKHRAFHCDGVGMRGDVVWKDEDGRLAAAHKIASYAQDEVVGAIHFGQKLADRFHGDLRPALDQFRTPIRHTVVVEDRGHLWPEPNWLRRHGGDNTIRRPLQQIPDEGAADTEPQHHELVDPQVIH